MRNLWRKGLRGRPRADGKKDKQARKRFQSIAAPLIVGVLCFGLVFFDLLSGLDYFLKDILYSNRRPTGSAVKIIAIDEKAIERFGPFGTWDRSVYAKLIDMLDADEVIRPAVIAFDVLFSGRAASAGDEAFAQAAQRAGNIICASHLVVSRQAALVAGQLSVQEDATGLELPYWLRESDDSVGFSNAVLQPDGTVRSAVIRAAYRGAELRSLAYQSYLRYCAFAGQQPLPVRTRQNAFIIDYAGNTGDFETVSLTSVLDGKIDPAAFYGSVVFIGAYTTGLQDNFITGTNRDAPLYGVEIHANILQNLMEGRQVLPADRTWVAVGITLAAMLYCLMVQRGKLLASTLLALGCIAAYLLVARQLFRTGLAVPVIYLPAFVLMMYAVIYLKMYFTERLHRTRLSNAFKKYVAPQVVDQLARDQHFEIKLGGELRSIAVLFIDIRGFTPLSESLPPQDVVSILNEYFALVTKVIFDYGGMLDKFIGDAAMAVFNAPVDLPDYEYRAVCTALDIVAGASALKRRLFEQHQKNVGFGIGVNLGEAVVGNIGCDFRMDYTAIGDTVNTAARLESNAKPGQVLISQRLYEKVKDRIVAEEIGVIPLKGKAEGVFVYNVTGRKQAFNEDKR